MDQASNFAYCLRTFIKVYTLPTKKNSAQNRKSPCSEDMRLTCRGKEGPHTVGPVTRRANLSYE